MKTGAGLALICVGAILAFAVTATPSFFNLHIAGWVLMLIGIIGLLVPRRSYGWLGKRVLVRRTRDWPGNDHVETVAVPPYVARNPGSARIEAGLAPTPTLDDPAVTGTTVPAPAQAPADAPRHPEETEVIEDLYEQ